MSRNSELRKPLQRRRKRGPPMDASRQAVFHRARGMCERCGKPITSSSWEDHHIFYKSHTSKLIQNELWNRCVLHDGCHFRIHAGDVEGRRMLEELALGRLRQNLAADVWRRIQKERRGEIPAATVIAYERYRRRTLAGWAEEAEVETFLGEN